MSVFHRPLAARVARKLNMSWHHPDLYFFFCLAASLAAFVAPSIIDDELLARRRKPPQGADGRPALGHGCHANTGSLKF